MASELDQSLLALCEEHGLESLSITAFTPAALGRTWFTATAQWFNPSGRQIASISADSVAQAVGSTISDMHAQRNTAEPVALADEVVTSEAQGEERKFYHSEWPLTQLLEARGDGMLIDDGEAWRYRYSHADANGKYDVLYRPTRAIQSHSPIAEAA